MMDATSGMYAVNQKAMPILAQPYNAGAPEVEGLTRLAAAGLRIAEVPVDMRERAERRVEAPGQEGRDARAHGRRRAAAGRATPAPPPLTAYGLAR